MSSGGDKSVENRAQPASDSDREPFLQRWSRRKADAREPAPAARSEPATPEPPKPPQSEMPGRAPPIDPAALPPIDSLTADSDFTVFLRDGVPEVLRKAALEKLWRTEPSVVNYVPLVEYNWDFNAPGYGALKAGDDVAKLARQLLGEVGRAADQAKPPAGPEPTTVAPAPAPEPPASADPPLASKSEPADPLPPRRRHGGALPT